MALDPYSQTIGECPSELGSNIMPEYWPRNITRSGSTDGPHSDMSGFHSLHSNDKAQKRNQNGATGGEGSSSSGNTDGSHSDISGFHSLHSNDQPQKRTPGDTKFSQSSIMSQPGTLASTKDASYPRVAITLDLPVCEADTSNGGSQMNQNRAPEGEGSFSSGSTDESHLDMSSLHSLLSNDKAQRRSPPDGSPRRDLLKPHSLSIKDVMAFALTGRTLSTDSSNSDMSGCHSLHSNDEVEGRTSGDTKSSQSSIMSQPGTLASTENASYVNDPKVIPPIATLRSEKGPSSDSDDFSKPATLASTESAPCDDAPQSSQFLHVGRSLSEISNWCTLRSTDSNPRRRRTPPMAALRSEKVTSSCYSDDMSQPCTLASTETAPRHGASQKPQFLRSLSEDGGSSEISNWCSLHSTERTPRRRRTPPIAALRSEKARPSDSDDFSHPATLASTETAPRHGASQSPQFLRSLSEVGGSSEISNWCSLHSTERTLRRPQFLRSLSEVGGSSEISNWQSLHSTDRSPRRRRLHST